VGDMKALLLATAAMLAGSAAHAEDWSVSPWTAEFDNVTVSAGGLAYGAQTNTFNSDKPSRLYVAGDTQESNTSMKGFPDALTPLSGRWMT